ncbi:MAG: glycoside hydrolase family 97 C-terminal domain-containing protein, partial [Rhodopirellula sp. JB053]
TVARRSGQTWYIASVGDQNRRVLDIPLDFLSPGIRYKATVFSDGKNAHGVKNPEAYEITSTTVSKSDILSVQLAAGGGNAMILHPIE